MSESPPPVVPDSSHSEDSESQAHGPCGCEHRSGPWETRSLILSGILAAGGLLGQWMGVGPRLAIVAIFCLAMIAGGWFIVRPAWRALLAFRPDMNLLMLLAIVGAAAIGQWAEAATVVCLFGLAEWLEGWAERRSHGAVQALLELAPNTASVWREGQLVEIPAAQVRIGEIVAVRSGMKIPLDGQVHRGVSSVNQAPITGESLPVEKQLGDSVFAGTINGEGSLEIHVTKECGDSILARIIRLVQEAQEQKSPVQRLVDKFAHAYTPIVTIAALGIFLVPPLWFGEAWTDWLYRACTMLIIACPCALVIATPVTIVAGLTALAHRGVLVKGGAHLEALGQLSALAFDKTGTITEGQPTVVGITTLGPKSEAEILRLAAAIDDHSSHPLAKAIVAAAKERGIEFNRADSYHARHGRGAVGTLRGEACFMGNPRFVHELGMSCHDLEPHLAAIELCGQTVVVVGRLPRHGLPGELYGVIALGDKTRAEVKAALSALRNAGVRRLVMLSGDNQRAVDTIARQVGLDQAHGNLLPEEKAGAIKALQLEHKFVGMVGDGVNDTPAMVAANLGIAMGAVGTDAVIETGDVALMDEDLGKVAAAVTLARRTMAIIRFNIAFALILKALFLMLTLAGHASLWLAILADTGATLLVVANALRLITQESKAS